MINRTIIGKEVARRLEVTQGRGHQVVGIVLEESISAALARGENVALKGFGTFALQHRAAREGRNPRTGEKIAVAASVGVTFRPSGALKAALNPDRPRRLKFSVNPPPQRMVGPDRGRAESQRKQA
jgi:nucleoid DNA-binding protein